MLWGTFLTFLNPDTSVNRPEHILLKSHSPQSTPLYTHIQTVSVYSPPWKAYGFITHKPTHYLNVHTHTRHTHTDKNTPCDAVTIRAPPPSVLSTLAPAVWLLVVKKEQ